MFREGINLQDATINIFGFSFKENVPDIRNTGVIDMILELESYGLKVQVTDAYAKASEVQQHYNVKLVDQIDLKQTDAIIFVVPHNVYTAQKWNLFKGLYKTDTTLVFDIKGILNGKTKPENVILRRLYFGRKKLI